MCARAPLYLCLCRLRRSRPKPRVRGLRWHPVLICTVPVPCSRSRTAPHQSRTVTIPYHTVDINKPAAGTEAQRLTLPPPVPLFRRTGLGPPFLLPFFPRLPLTNFTPARRRKLFAAGQAKNTTLLPSVPWLFPSCSVRLCARKLGHFPIGDSPSARSTQSQEKSHTPKEYHRRRGQRQPGWCIVSPPKDNRLTDAHTHAHARSCTVVARVTHALLPVEQTNALNETTSQDAARRIHQARGVPPAV